MTDNQPTDTTTTARPAGAGHAAAGTGGDRLADACNDCGAALLLCEHATARLIEPSLAFQAKIIADLEEAFCAKDAEVERLQALMAALSARVEDVLADRSWSASHQALVVEADAVAGLMSLLWRGVSAAPAAAPDSQEGGTAPADRGPQ